jgi:hypothetical protein
MKEIKDFLQEMYELFVLRDVAYLVSGAWLLFHIHYVVNGYSFDVFIDHLTKDTKHLLVYAALAYFLGLFCYLTACNLKLIEIDPKDFKQNYHKARASLLKEGNEYVNKVLERTVFFQMASLSLFSSSCGSLLLDSFKILTDYRKSDIYYLGVTVLIALVSRFNGKREVRYENSLLLAFASECKDK